MAQPPTSTTPRAPYNPDPAYDPLPLTNDDRQAHHALYNASPSVSSIDLPNEQGSQYYGQQNAYGHQQGPYGYQQDPYSQQQGPYGHSAPYHDDMGIPMAGAQPRFLGRALYDDGVAQPRSSFASSHHTLPSRDNASIFTTESTHNLNPTYHDDPGFFNADQPSMSRRRSEKRPYAQPKSSRRKHILIGVGVLVVIAAAAGAVLALTVFKKKSSNNSPDSSSPSATNSSANTGGTPVKVAIVTGGDGSTVTADDGSSFTYSNPYGGTWYFDVNDPFNNGARPQTWSPALNETFKWGVDKIRGVNLGGWLVTEPFIVPGLYQTIQSRPTTQAANITIIDEWTLLQAMALDTANGGTSQLEDHYKTFITEQDFMEIAAAGLNFVRIPLGYWAIEVHDGENFLPKVSWQYFLKAVQWARKYGLRINLDLHALPGSQNGWNHSGRLGSFNVLYGPMGIANAQRALDYIRILAEFISQPEYRDVVAAFGVTNEPQGFSTGLDPLSRYYFAAYQNVRLASGTGLGNGPVVTFHDGFIDVTKWYGFAVGADRLALERHPYLCFTGQSKDPITAYGTRPCDTWGKQINDTMQNYGFVMAGEFSNAVTDCGLYVNGPGQGIRYEGTYFDQGPWPVLGNCSTDWTNWEQWDATTKTAYNTFAKASMDALQNWFFWTWKIGNSTAGRVESPQWSYKLGLDNGWMPKDPREAIGQCGNTAPAPPLSAWQTGGAGAGQIATDVLNELSWPPPTISFPNGAFTSGTLLPAFAPAGTPITLPGPTFTGPGGEKPTTTVNPGSGWFNQQDNAGMMGPVPGCAYFDAYVGSSFPPPAPLCTNAAGPGQRRDEGEAPKPVITEAPKERMQHVRKRD